MKRAIVVAIVAGLALPACSLGSHGGERTYQADFVRAIQVFPGVKVRVLGVQVGTVTEVRNEPGAVQVTLHITDKDIRLPVDVQAAVVPMSLLGERYIQLFPAYQSGPALATGATIPLSRTAVPAEPDELLRSLQDYLGGLDPKVVTAFVENAAQALQGSGQNLNHLIQYGAGVLSELNSRRGDLSQIVVQLNSLVSAVSTRQQSLGLLIRNYDTVAGTLNANRTALEGTITGLNQAAAALASLLLAHRAPLESDVRTLTRTAQTLQRNEDTFALTGRWATDLFEAASRAVDYNHDWLRLNNQGEPLAALVLLRLEQRLEEICIDQHIPRCGNPNFWKAHVPSLFCFDVVCPGKSGGPAQQIGAALRTVPGMAQYFDGQAMKNGTDTNGLVDTLLAKTVGDPGAYSWYGGGQSP